MFIRNISLSLEGKKSFGKVLKSIKPKRGNEIEIIIARLGIAKAQVRKDLYFFRIFSL
jgi:hypothetical protein